MLQIRNISYQVRDGNTYKEVLRNLTCDFYSGSITTVTGPSGAGKTTLLSILSLVVTPTSGEILHNDVSLSTLSAKSKQAYRQAAIGIIFQTARTLSKLTVLEQIQFTAASIASAESEETALARARRLGIQGLFHHLPSELSGGEKQRVALTLALMKQPTIVLADEPTAALDRESSVKLVDELRRYANDFKATVVAVSHDEMLVQASNSTERLG